MDLGNLLICHIFVSSKMFISRCNCLLLFCIIRSSKVSIPCCSCLLLLLYIINLKIIFMHTQIIFMHNIIRNLTCKKIGSYNFILIPYNHTNFHDMHINALLHKYDAVHCVGQHCDKLEQNNVIVDYFEFIKSLC